MNSTTLVMDNLIGMKLFNTGISPTTALGKVIKFRYYLFSARTTEIYDYYYDILANNNGAV